MQSNFNKGNLTLEIFFLISEPFKAILIYKI